MKILAIENGWKEAPHCWRHFILSPVRIDRTPTWISISILGIVFFLGK